MIIYDDSLPQVKELMSTDIKLNNLIKYIKSAAIDIEPDGFKCLVKYIIGQQISDKARETIWQRLCELCPNFDPLLIQHLNDDLLRSIGLSYRKVEYIKSLADAIVNKNIIFSKMKELSNEEIINNLVNVKGIGKWTAEMYLIFSLGRENVLSKDDGTIKRVIQWMYHLDALPSPKELENYFDQWKDKETIVSAFFWKAIELDLLKQDFDKIC